MEISDILKTITIKPGDCLVLKGDYDRGDIHDLMFDLGKKSIPRGTIIFFVKELDDINLLDEKEMERMGWVRKEKCVDVDDHWTGDRID